ncbi:hypothetical protein [Acinetobacter sp. WZC-1]|uniref:hypothetical protein n=1 Tax=Acinetobacter sp. WZC-1 TaxID=3459034 RepID=UPI00403DCEA0
MNSSFGIDYVSDSEYEELTVEISFGGQILCQISQDKGKDKLEIEFFHQFYLNKNDEKFKFFLKDFLDVVNEAISDLWG